MPKVYLDHHTVTQPDAASIAAWLPFLKEQWGSTTAPHQMGQELFPHLEASLEAIGKCLGAPKKETFYLFSSNAEAIGHLYQTHYFEEIRQSGKNHLLTSTIEDAPIVMSLKRLEELGCVNKTVPVDEQGQVTRDALAEALSPRTSLVSLSWANGLTGVIHPIADLAELCRERGVKLHVDASYVMGKLYFQFEELNVDFLSFEGSLIHAPKGTAGLLMAKEGQVPVSWMAGVDVGALAALAAALQKNEEMFDHICLETARLRDKLERGIVQAVSDAEVLFQGVERLPNCSCITFPGTLSEALLYLLHRKGIYASLGGGRAQRLSHVLLASGIDAKRAESALSFALSFQTREAEIDEAIQQIASCVEVLRKCSRGIL